VPVRRRHREIGADGQLLAVHGVLHLAAIDTVSPSATWTCANGGC